MELTEIPAFALERTFEAPRALVWRCWTEARHLGRWWGPKGCSIEVKRLDLQPGGAFHYAMRFGAAPPMWGRFVFREIRAPERLVWVNSFSDPEGGLAPVPFAGEWPAEMLTTVVFTEEAERTRVAVRVVPIHPSEAEAATFQGGLASMAEGWGGSLDVLEGYLGEAD